MSGAYYNEIDPYAAQWLRNLIAAGHIASGDVDERSILDVRPDDLRGYTQCHFFAGVGVWSYALRCAGWADERPVWTGSCPCQPFSTAGKGSGFDDERHLWPAFYHLIGERRPPVVFGEQVGSKGGLAWLDLVQTDLEAAGYAFGAFDLCAAGFGAPHIRQRLYFVADNAGIRRERGQDTSRPVIEGAREWREGLSVTERSSNARELGNNNNTGLEGRSLPSAPGGGRGGSECAARAAGAVDGASSVQPRGPTGGFWRDADWLPCIDGKARPTKPGLQPLAHGSPGSVGRVCATCLQMAAEAVSQCGPSGTCESCGQFAEVYVVRMQGNRIGRLRAYGNAIVAPQAQEFIEAYLAVRP